MGFILALTALAVVIPLSVVGLPYLGGGWRWRTDACSRVDELLERGIPSGRIASVVATAELGPLDAQCLDRAPVPMEIRVAALRNLVRGHPRYRPVLLQRERELDEEKRRSEDNPR